MRETRTQGQAFRRRLVEENGGSFAAAISDARGCAAYWRSAIRQATTARDLDKAIRQFNRWDFIREELPYDASAAGVKVEREPPHSFYFLERRRGKKKPA